jgi:hypothetical protein
MKLYWAILALVFGSVAASGGTLFFVASFSQDDNVVLIPFSTLGSTLVTMETTSFGSGAKGFEPVLTLYDGSGNLLLQDSTGGTAPSSCGGRAIDPFSGFCLDAVISQVLPTGSYTLALTEWDNIPSGPTLADGFPDTGTGNFTGSEFGCGAGGFFLFDCTQRTAGWAVQIQGAAVPEPATMGLSGIGILALILAAAKLRRNA